MWTNKYDPVMTCKPLGLPRHGTPARIIQTDKDVIFFYRRCRLRRRQQRVPRHPHGRPRATRAGEATTFYGDSIGNWEGDTLVIDSINFDDSTWLGRGGLFHSGSMRIVERLTRVGNEIRYDMTIEDPESFIEPWVMTPRTLRPDAAATTPGSSPSARTAKSTKSGSSPRSFGTNPRRVLTGS